MLVTVTRYAEMAGINRHTVYARLRAGTLKAAPEDPETGLGMQLIDTAKYSPSMKVKKGAPVRGRPAGDNWNIPDKIPKIYWSQKEICKEFNISINKLNQTIIKIHLDGNKFTKEKYLEIKKYLSNKVPLK